MKWVKPEYKITEVNWAGKVLIGKKEGDRDKALEILNNWRAIHIFPLILFNLD